MTVSNSVFKYDIDKVVVRFTQSAGALMRENVRTFVEVGPGNVLSGLLKRIDRSVKAIPVNSLAALEKLEEIPSTA